MAAESSFMTLTLPDVESGIQEGSVAVVAQAPPDRWMRVQVRNNAFGGAACRLASDETALLSASASMYILPAGQSDVFVLAPGQRLFGSSASEACLISVHMSWALPLDVAPAKMLSL